MACVAKTVGWVLVLCGLLAPVGALILTYRYPEEVKTYRDVYRAYSALTEQQQQEMLTRLDFLIDSRSKVREALPSLEIDHTLRSIREERTTE